MTGAHDAMQEATATRDEGLARMATERLNLGEVRRHDFVGDVGLTSVARALWRRRWLIGTVVAAFLCAAVAYNELAAPVFEARARLMIEPESPQVTGFRTAMNEDQGRIDYFVTQMEVLRSRALARRTLEELHLLGADERRQSAQVDGFIGSLTVSPVRTASGESRVVSVTFRSSDAERAAQVANQLAKAYVDQNLDLRREGSRQAGKWLNERLLELRQQVDSSQQALQNYRERNDGVSLDDPQNIVNQKLAQLNVAVTAARMERVDKQAVYDQLRTIQARGAALDTFPPILSNAFIQGLKSELAGLQRERLQLSNRLGAAHPDIIKLDAAITNAERRLNAEMSKVVEGIGNDFKTSQAREQGLAAELNQQKREVLSLSQQSIGYGSLQRDAASTKQVFESILQRVKETDLASELQTNNARILDEAEAPSSPVWPRPWLNLLAAMISGSVVAFGLAVGLEYVNPRIARPDEIGLVLGVPLLGIVPRISGLKGGAVRADVLPPIFLEALRGIRTRILLSRVTSVARTLAITSTSAEEGKTMIASSLAISMAAAGRQVLLVDADMRRPQQHRVFGTVRTPGLSNVMAKQLKPKDAVVETSVRGLFVLPAGAGVDRPSELLDPARLKELVSGFAEVFDVVILDSPPVMSVADASIIANAVSAVLFVVGANKTGREMAQVALERLTSVQAYVAGVVLNKYEPDGRTDHYYAYDMQGDEALEAHVVG